MTRRPASGKTRIDSLKTGPHIDQQPTTGAGLAGPIGRLTAFHAEIRQATAALVALVDAASRGAIDAAEADRLTAFFRGPLLWHDEDEEVGLFPRLRRLDLSKSERAIIEATSRQHDRMEELLEHLGPVLAGMAGGEYERVELAAAATEARALHLLLARLMKLEEDSLFPLASERLARSELEELEKEMEARHGDSNERTRRAVEL